MGKKGKKKIKDFFNDDLLLVHGSEEDFAELVDDFGGIYDFDEEIDLAALATSKQKPAHNHQTNKVPAEIFEVNRTAVDTTTASPESKPSRTFTASEYELTKFLLENIEMGNFSSATYMKIGDIHVPATARNIGKALLAYAPIEMQKQLKIRSTVGVSERINLILENSESQLELPNHLVLFQNGIWNLKKQCWDTPSNHYLFPFKIKANYHPDVEIKTPYFDEFIHSTCHGDKEIMQRILEFLGYTLIPGAPAKAIFVLGTARDSGKSILAEFLTRLFGAINTSAINLHDFDEGFAVSQIHGKAINFSMDVSGAALKPKAAANLKAMSGHDMVSYAAKYEQYSSYINLANLYSELMTGFISNTTTKLFTNAL